MATLPKLTLRPVFPCRSSLLLHGQCPLSGYKLLPLASPLIFSLRWAVCALDGGGWSKPVWAITAIITASLVTLQANAMWKRLIHGSQVLNTATPPAEAVIPPAVSDPQQLPSLFPPQAPLSGGKGGGCRGEGVLWLPGGQTQDVGNKGRVLRTHFIPIHNLCLNSHGIQTAAPNKAQV